MDKIEKRMNLIEKIDPQHEDTHLSDQRLNELQENSKNVYDFVFYGADRETPLRAACPGETKSVQIRVKKTTARINQDNDPQSSTSIPTTEITPAESIRSSSRKSRNGFTTPSKLSQLKNGIPLIRNIFQPRSQSVKSESDIDYQTITYTGQVLRAKKPIKKEYYWPSLHLCDENLEPAFILISANEECNIYEVGYMVEFQNKHEQPFGEYDANIITPDNIIWYYLVHYAFDKKTSSTKFAFHHIPFYDMVKNDIKDIHLHTDYTINENIFPSDMKLDDLYSKEHQEDVFKSLFGGTFHTYFNPQAGLIFEKQELIDQRTLPIVSWRLAALSYMNIVPMYKIVREQWRKVEDAIMQMPYDENQPAKKEGEEIEFDKQTDQKRIDSYNYPPVIRLVSGTYGQLIIADKPIYLSPKQISGSDDKLVVPYAFFKLVQVEYLPPNSISPNPLRATHFFTIVIVTHNNPFEKNPKVIDACDERLTSCADYGWNIDQDDPTKGFTYCCKYTLGFIDKFQLGDIEKSVRSNRVLNLTTLKDVITMQLFYRETEVKAEDRSPAIPDPQLLVTTVRSV